MFNTFHKILIMFGNLYALENNTVASKRSKASKKAIFKNQIKMDQINQILFQR